MIPVLLLSTRGWPDPPKSGSTRRFPAQKPSQRRAWSQLSVYSSYSPPYSECGSLQKGVALNEFQKSACVFLVLMFIFTVVTAVAVAQHPKNKENRIGGTIQMINRDDKVLTLRIGTAATQRQVAYTDETKITRQIPAEWSMT